ncbi:hypothetical protein E2C01_048188 [Portunus trituberculatus]|uniref:Uncharacterized protein n=1 Tax=Portunus trituberculatus TaxID=210409 RepID=A0A5B7GAV8_PORTR|nr:hypothetical protein [Portunus trituberculatus]
MRSSERTRCPKPWCPSNGRSDIEPCLSLSLSVTVQREPVSSAQLTYPRPVPASSAQWPRQPSLVHADSRVTPAGGTPFDAPNKNTLNTRVTAAARL